jgi:hypothetical protein
MPVTPGHFTLTPEQRQFKQLLDAHPTLVPFWDFESTSLDLAALERALPAMSHGEQIMARFFAAVWLGENKFDFDLVDAAATLDDKHRQLIVDWLASPMFP